MQTNKGLIKIDLWPEKAPEHCRSIIGLSRIGFYNGLIFHRVVKRFVIQGGCPLGNGTGGPGYKVRAEFSDLQHEAGVLSMARASDPNSAGSQFFLCLDRVPYLDGQYTVFGKTADDDSLKVVLEIGQSPTDASDRPVNTVRIDKCDVAIIPVAA